ELHRTGYTGLCQSSSRNVVHHCITACYRCSRRQLCNTDQVLFVLCGHEAFRQGANAKHANGKQATVYQQRNTTATYGALHCMLVTRPGAFKDTIEAPKESTEHAIHHARQSIWRAVMRL